MVRFRGVIANLRQSKRKVKLLLDVEAQARLNSKHKSSLKKSNGAFRKGFGGKRLKCCLEGIWDVPPFHRA